MWAQSCFIFRMATKQKTILDHEELDIAYFCTLCMTSIGLELEICEIKSGSERKGHRYYLCH